MGTVFLAEQLALGNRPVVIKILRRRLLDDPAFLQRFREEASSTGRIRHRNVVTVHECGQTDDGSPYIAMEYLEGESLRQILKRRSSLPLDAIIEILQQAARGLHAAHKLGIIHRDLKPDNIFLTHDDEGQPLVKILDFGIAKMRESTTHTVTGLAIGTPAYMSVEQAGGMRSEEMDGRSDVYSLGIVVYEMITGQVPFKADTPLAHVRKHLVEPPPPLSRIRPDLQIPPKTEDVLMRALSKHREERYSSAPDFAREFLAAMTKPSDVVAQSQHKPAIAGSDELRAPCLPSSNTPPAVPPEEIRQMEAPVVNKQSVVTPAEVRRPSRARRARDADNKATARSLTVPKSRAFSPIQNAAILSAVALAFVGLAMWGIMSSGRDTSSTPLSASTTRTSISNPKTETSNTAVSASILTPDPHSNPPGIQVSSAAQTSRNQNFSGRQRPACAQASDARRTKKRVAAPRLSAESSIPGNTSRDSAEKIEAATALGDFYLNRGKYVRAIAEYKKGLDADPSNSAVRSKIARAEQAKAAEERVNRQ